MDKKLAKAVTKEPKCSGPLGVGAKRPQTSIAVSHQKKDPQQRGPTLKIFGEGPGARTPDQEIKSLLLYQLS